MYRHDKSRIGVMKVRYLANSSKHSLVILGKSSAFSFIGKGNKVSRPCIWSLLAEGTINGNGWYAFFILCHGASHNNLRYKEGGFRFYPRFS